MPRYRATLRYLRLTIVGDDSEERAKEIANIPMASFLASRDVAKGIVVHRSPQGEGSCIILKRVTVTQDIVANSLRHAKAIVDDQMVGKVHDDAPEYRNVTIRKL
ncbi:MAG: hypothetical protein HQ567_14325 [Candidatus Nealsonbacteria bacterium]|nr:hypothetical protein [Candidatus Nealsonbacteria bacterium]